MKKSSHPRLHFRHLDHRDSTPYNTCCSIVDVCVNRDLLAAIRQNYQLEENGILVRLHWETSTKHKSVMSTITVHPAEKSKTQIHPQNAVALATNNLALREFASDMFGMHNVRLVMIQYPPLVMTFQHEDDSNESMFSDETSLRGILKGLLSQCVPSEKHMKFSFNINKWQNTRLPKLSFCQCLVTRSRDEHNGVFKTCKAITTADTSCQTVTTPDIMMTHSTKHCTKAKCNDVTSIPGKIEERFIALERELTDQRKFIEIQLNEQKQRNEEMKALLHHITENVTKALKNNETEKSEKGGQTKHILDEPNLETEDGMILCVNENRRKAEDNVNIDRLGTCRRQEDSSDETLASEDIKTDNEKAKETKGSDSLRQEEEQFRVGAKDKEAYLQEADEEERTNQKPSRGPVLKEIIGTEMKSLPSLRPKTEMKTMISLEKTSSLSFDQSGYTRSESCNCKVMRSRSRGVNERKDKTARYGKDGDFWNDSSTTPGECKVHNQCYRKTMMTDADLTTSVERHRTKSQGANQYDDYDDFGIDDITYDGHTSSKEYYSDLQRNAMNFNVSLHQAATRYATVAKTKLSDEPNGEDQFRLLIDCMTGDNPNREKLCESVEDALAEVDESSVPNVDTALDTVILLDTSGSINGDTFQQMKATVLEFINGVENTAEDSELEENIGIVTFGGHARILHHLSNDYGSVRDAIDEITPGGPSPMLEGVLLSMTCLSKGGEVNFMDIVKLPPRLIIMTDGIATGELSETSVDKTAIDEQQKMLLDNAFELLKRRQPGDYLQGQVTIVPLGNSDMSFLLSLASSCGGTLLQSSKVKELCSYQRLHKLAGDMLDKMKGSHPSEFLNGLKALAIYPESQVTEKEMTEVCDIVQDHLGSIVISYNTIYKFNNIHEVPGLPPLGSRVTRGVDWIWGNQDTDGAGTIFNHGLDGRYLWVLWDNGVYNVYRYGKNDCFDIQVVHDRPRQPTHIEEIYMGLHVERGPDWHVMYGNQDGGRGSRGVIVRERPTLQRVMVRWQNGKIYEYRYGENNRFDVSVLDPHACLLESTSQA